MTYRHYSFDVWLTLIRSNPAFRRERTAYFAEHFNPLGRSLAEVDSLIREVDVACTRINELVGRNIDAQELFLLMAQRLGTDLAGVTPERLQRAQHDLGELFLANPPRLLDAHLPAVLTELRARGATLSLLSNTGLIPGALLRQVWPVFGLGGMFAFQLYSDEVSLSKPNPALYNRLYELVRQLPEHQSVTLQRTDVIHVGDNPVADQAGATAAGLNAHLLNPDRPEFTHFLT
ncbi:MAG: HAD family hydrolase, partial [Sphingobacteriaceae bacterium]|nr:HAD family hydrolase [Cytophagaceae bacterium]